MKSVPKQPELEAEHDQPRQPRGKNAKKAELLDRALKHGQPQPIHIPGSTDGDSDA